ncbi:hypothetical protein BN59_00482 [Legionella massiliensis]|uniref:Transposase IS116/IS110/IS902 family protein n=1 Tax=Legionella massiliensis TaxID=1034943 RepID=A0A078KP94_9GAMM|nr:hypothetical protein [Legionella massiliensis]CDZ76215.1 hypothetical protein BN59_00482 [Legionella massiliensis]CEE11953.1 hypothetical protein BN1094_00482 [Legionella massiliensis]
MEKNRLDKASSEQCESIGRVLEVLEHELELIDEAQQKLANGHADFSQKNEIVQSIKGVASITALSMLAELPELGSIGHSRISSF